MTIDRIIFVNYNAGIRKTIYKTGDAGMDLDETKLGETIRRIRIRKGLPLEEVAAKASLSPISVRALELGRGSTLSTMLKVLNAMDEAGFILDWAEKSREISPMQALRKARKQEEEPKRVSRKSVRG